MASARTPRAPVKGTNKWDYEIAKVRSRDSLYRVLAYGLVVAACLAVVTLPLGAMHGIIQPIAGKKTEIVLNVPIEIAFGISFVVNIALGIKGRSQRSEIKRNRARADKYEGDLGVGD